MMRWTRMLAVPALLATGFGCGQATSDMGEEPIGQVTQAITSTGHDAIWWQDIVDDVANVSLAPDFLDQFQIHAGDVVHWRLKFGAWSGGAAMGRPAGVTFKAIAAADTGGVIDIFALGSNNRIWHRYSSDFSQDEAVTWNTPWEQVANTGAVSSTSKLAMTSWGFGRMDVFWITSASKIGHAWYDDFVLGGTESGAGWLQNLPGFRIGNVEAVSWGPGRIDLFLADVGDGFNIKHHFWDNGNFGRAEYRANGPGIVDGSMSVNSLAVTSAGPGQLSVLVRPEPNEPQSEPVSDVRFVNISGMQPNRSDLTFQRMTGLLPDALPSAPFFIMDAVRRIEGGVVKNELWGAGDVSNAPIYSVFFND